MHKKTFIYAVILLLLFNVFFSVFAISVNADAPAPPDDKKDCPPSYVGQTKYFYFTGKEKGGKKELIECDKGTKKTKEYKEKKKKVKIPKGKSPYTFGLSVLGTTVSLTPFSGNEYLEPITDLDDYITDAEDDFIHAVTESVKNASIGNNFFKEFLGYYITHPEVEQDNIVQILYPEIYTSFKSQRRKWYPNALYRSSVIIRGDEMWLGALQGYVIIPSLDSEDHIRVDFIRMTGIHEGNFAGSGARVAEYLNNDEEFDRAKNKINESLKSFKRGSIRDLENRFNLSVDPVPQSTLTHDNKNVYLPNVSPEYFPDIGQTVEYSPSEIGVVEIDGEDYLEIEYKPENDPNNPLSPNNPNRINTLSPVRPDKDNIKDNRPAPLLPSKPETNPIPDPNPDPSPNPNPDPSPDPNPDPSPDPNPDPSPEPSPTVPTPPTGLPNDGKTCGELDLELKSIDLFTTKFPFSLPWDVLNAIEAIFGDIGSNDPEFKFKLMSTEIEIKIPDFILNSKKFLHSVLIILFDIGVIYALHRLFGGAS